MIFWNYFCISILKFEMLSEYEFIPMLKEFIPHLHEFIQHVKEFRLRQVFPYCHGKIRFNSSADDGFCIGKWIMAPWWNAKLPQSGLCPCHCLLWQNGSFFKMTLFVSERHAILHWKALILLCCIALRITYS